MRPAHAPVQRPEDAKLLVVGPDGRLRHARRARLPTWLGPGDLLVANDAATLPASLRGVHVRTRRSLEVRLAGRASLRHDDVRAFIALVFGEGDHRTPTEERPSPPTLRPGDELRLGPLSARVLRRCRHRRLVALELLGSVGEVWTAIARHGRPIQYAHVREPVALWDVWTRIAGPPVAFEPPSAGFALDWQMLTELGNRGVGFATITLAAGISSTGDPVLDARLPFDEPYLVPRSTAVAIDLAKERGGRVVAVGTTVVRALESAVGPEGRVRPGLGTARGRLGPTSVLRVVDGILSGVHVPGESHHELLRAFASDAVLATAGAALRAAGYRTHEFGDSVLLWRSKGRVVGSGHDSAGGAMRETEPPDRDYSDFSTSIGSTRDASRAASTDAAIATTTSAAATDA